MQPTPNEIDLISTIKNSADPKLVAEYAFSLILDYLRKHAPSAESSAVLPPESA